MRQDSSMNMNEPFLLRDALKAGYSRRKIQATPFRRLFHGVYVLGAEPLDARREGCAVLLAAGPGAFLSHHQAARLYGATVPHTDVFHASVREDRHRSRRKEIAVHKSARTPTTFRGLPVTSPEDTFADMAAHLSTVDLVVLGDSLVRLKRATSDQLIRASENALPQLRSHALTAAQLVRTGTDSPMETRSRLLIVLAGLPEPEVNICFFNEYGDVVRRTEMGYRDYRLAIEYDGRHHAETQAQWEADIARREEFDGADWRIVTLLAKDIYRTPGKTLERIVAAMRKEGMRVSISSDEWRRHFPEVSAYI